jgi:hypothetical protein
MDGQKKESGQFTEIVGSRLAMAGWHRPNRDWR